MGRLALCLVGSAMIAMTIGCSDEDGSGGGAGAAGSGGTGGATGTGGAAGNGGGGIGGASMVMLTATATEAPSIDSGIFDGPPLEGVDLCEADTTNCATTDAAGLAQIMVPANQEVTYTLSKDGFLPYVIGDVSEPPGIGTTWPMISDALIAAEAERVGFSWPSENGLVALAAFPLHAGVTWEVDDATTTVYYLDEDGLAQSDLTATTTTGRGGFYDTSVGVREVDFGGTVANCTTAIAWPGTAAN
ncbi:MAG: hypothetical protein WBM75_02600 [Polyangiales bacterium]